GAGKHPYSGESSYIAPSDRLRTWRTLVWSRMGEPEGEELRRPGPRRPGLRPRRGAASSAYSYAGASAANSGSLRAQFDVVSVATLWPNARSAGHNPAARV